VSPPADPDHRPGDLPLEGHVLERDTGLDLRDELLRAKGDVVFARFVPVHWRRHVGRVGRNPVDVDLAGGVQFGDDVLGLVLRWRRLRVHRRTDTARDGADRSDPERCNHLPPAEVL